jgi:hypothetical protein
LATTTRRYGLIGGATPRSRQPPRNTRTISILATESGGRADEAKEERQGGNGCGDTARLQVRGILRGVRHAPSRNVPVDPSTASVVMMAARCRKHGEPQDRQQDATSLRPSERRKPSRWCKTTRTEHGSNRQFEPEIRWRHRMGVDARSACRWRGDTGGPRASACHGESHERRSVYRPGRSGALK